MSNDLKTDFGRFLSLKNDDIARNSLAKLLVLVDSMGGSPLMIHQFNHKRYVANELPQKGNASIIHKRYYMKTFSNKTLETIALPDNICVECSIVRDNYTVRNNQFFEPTVIVRYIMKNKRNIMVNLL